MSLEISKSEMPISAEGFNTQHRRVEKFLCKFLIQPPVFYGRFAHYFFLSDMLEVFKYSAVTDLVRYITSTQLTQNKSSENRNIGVESDFHFILRWNYLLMFHQLNPKKIVVDMKRILPIRLRGNCMFLSVGGYQLCYWDIFH